jgi:hypothetical protein
MATGTSKSVRTLAPALGGAVFLASLALTGCAGRSSVTQPAAEVAVRIVPFRVGDGSGDDIVMDRRGRLERARTGEALGILRHDGRFLDEGGDLRFTLGPDGSIVRDDGTALPVALTTEATLRHRGAELEVRIWDDGAVVGVDSTLPGAVIEEVFAHVEVEGDLAAARRAILFTLAVADELMGE